MAGLATYTLTHITELRVSRDIAAGLIAQTTTPQVLVRMGQILRIEDVPPRARPIDEVFEFGSKDRTVDRKARDFRLFASRRSGNNVER